MTLIATLGAVNSNSYVTESEADSYMENRAFAFSTWNSYNSTLKEQLLITSSQALDWYANWKGYKVSEYQSMAWPRSSVIRGSGEEVLETELPLEVKTAVYEMAISFFGGDRTEDDPLAGFGNVKIGPLSFSTGPEKPNQTNKKVMPEKVQKIVKDLILYGGSVIRPLLRF